MPGSLFYELFFQLDGTTHSVRVCVCMRACVRACVQECWCVGVWGAGHNFYRKNIFLKKIGVVPKPFVEKNTKPSFGGWVGGPLALFVKKMPSVP